jgi:hypothetical protein
MSERREHQNSIPLGPGGLHCECCRPPGTLKEIKTLINRSYRRKVKQKDRKEQEENAQDI